MSQLSLVFDAKPQEIAIIYLRRQGASREVNMNNNHDLPYYIRIYPYQKSFPLFMLEICHGYQHKLYGNHGQRVVGGAKYGLRSMDELKRIAEREVYEIFGERIRIADETMGYMKDFGIHYDYMDNDIFPE